MANLNRILCLAAFLAASGAQFATAVDKSDDERLIESLDAAVEQWLRDVEFASTYKRSVGRAATVEQALAGQWGMEMENQRVTGVFNKASGLVRCSGDPAPDPLVTNETPGVSKTVAFLDFDEVSSPDVLLAYKPVVDPSSTAGSATFSSRKRSANVRMPSLGEFAAGLSSDRRIGPLSIDGSEFGSYIKAPRDAASVSRSIVRSDPDSGDSVIVEVKYEHRGARTESRVEFSLSGTVPVVRRVSLLQAYPTQQHEGYSQAMNFVECPGGPVARLVRDVWKNDDARYPKLPWVVFEWKSNDLGNRPPEHADFLVPIAAKTVIRGLRDRSVALHDGKLDISKVTLHDLEDFSGGGKGVLAREELAGMSSRRKWLLGANLVLLAFVLCVALWRARARRRPPPMNPPRT